jgi:hypothetical protein
MAKLDLKGYIPKCHCCVDCGYNTAPGCDTRAEAEAAYAAGADAIKQTFDKQSEVYIVHNHVWQKAGMPEWSYSGEGCLCIGCLERRIGRPLGPDDFPDHPFNTLPGSARLLERRGHVLDVLGDFPEDELALA